MPLFSRNHSLEMIPLRSTKGVLSFKSTSWFTLVELIVVITILAILATVGFVVMSHQTSVARDGKRISEIQSLSSASRITTAQLRELPRPIADSLELTVSGSFIGYQGFMSTTLVNPLGYGSDKIFDPLDGAPYTYRVNKNYDQAQFMAYLENPRFERSIEIAKQSLPLLLSKAYALDSSTTDLSSRYPYSAGDKLGIFVSSGSNQPLQNGVTGTGSRDISLSDSSTLHIIVGSSWADGYVSTDISTWSLLSLKDGSFDEKALLGMNSGSSGSGSGGGDSGGGGLPVSHILTMGEYSIMGETYYGYIGPLTISAYATYGVIITTVTPGSLIDDTVDGYVIDAILLDSSYSSPITILAGNSDMPLNVAFETPYANISCTPQSSFLDITPYSCTGSTVSTDFYVGSQHDLGITIGAIPPPPPPSLPAPSNVIDAPVNTEIISNVVTASNISTPVPLTVSGAEFRVNGWSWVISANINNGDQVEYKVQAWGENEWKNVTINFNGEISTWVVNAYSCFYYSQESYGDIRINGYKIGCSENVVIPSVLFGGNVNQINYDAFRNSPITSIIISEGIQYIWDDAFRESQLISASLPSTLIFIWNHAFQNAQLTSVNIPYGITRIWWDTFLGNNLTSVTIPSSVTIIDSGAFQYNQLTSVTIPDGVTTIGWSAFQGNNLTSITIPNSVTTIGWFAFHVNNLTSITIPNSVTSIWGDAFADQTNSPGNGTIYGPSSGYVKDTYTNNGDDQFDKVKLPNYVDLP